MHVFVDESQRPNGYLLGAALVSDAGALARIRTELRDLRRPGQQRLHFVKESDARRKALLTAMLATGVRARVYSCRAVPREARGACLIALVADIVPAGARRLVLESRESMNHHDVCAINSALRKYGEGSLEYLHLRPQEEPVLWVADGSARCLMRMCN